MRERLYQVDCRTEDGGFYTVTVSDALEYAWAMEPNKFFERMIACALERCDLEQEMIDYMLENRWKIYRWMTA